MLGSNIKVHFAGSDNDPQAGVARDMTHVNYDLFSCYPFIANKKITDDFKPKPDAVFVPSIAQKKKKSYHHGFRVIHSDVRSR